MSFTVKLCHNSSPVEKIGKSLDTGLDITGCVLKESTSILRPVIRIRTNSDITGYNYMFISEFSRYYFIDDIVSIHNDVWEVSGHVDVLETYATEIKANTAVIKRQQNLYNLYLDDPEFKALNYDNIQTLKFPANSFSKSMSYMLVINGKVGS